MKWPRRILQVLLAPLRLLLLVLVPCLVTGLAFLLYSESGSALLMQVVSRVTQGAIHSESISGPLTGPLVVDGLVYEDKSVRVEIAHAELDWNFYALAFQQLKVSELKATRVHLLLKHTPPDPEERDTLTQLPLALLVRQAQIATLVVEVKNAPLQFDDIQLSVNWIGDRIMVETLSTHFAPLGALNLKGELRMEPRQLRIVDAELGGYGEIRLSGVIGYHDHFSADASWHNLHWPQTGTARVLSPSGKLHAEGGWDAYRFEMQGQVNAEDIPADFSAKGTGSTAALDIAQMEAQMLKGRIAAQAHIGWSPQLQISAQGTVQQLDPSELWPQWPGQIGGEFQASADWAAGDMVSKFEIDLRGSQLRDFPFSLQSRGSYQAEALTLLQFDLHSGRSRLQAQGRVTPPFDLKAELNSPDLANLWPELGGSAKLSARLGGTVELPHLLTQAEIKQVRYQDYSLEQARLDADLHPKKVSRLDLTAEKLRAGIDIASVKLHADGTAAKHQLQFETSTDSGDVQLGLRGALDLQARQWKGELASGRGIPQDLPAWRLEEAAKLELAQGDSMLEPACWRSQSGRVCLQFRQQSAVTRLAFRLENWAFAYFQSFLPPQWTLSGATSGTGALVFDATGLRSARVDLQTTTGQLKVGEQVAMAFQPSSLLVSEETDGLKVMLNVPMQGGGIQLDASLTAAPAMAQRNLKGQLRLDFSDLAPLRMLTPEIEAVSGRVHGELALSGTAVHPRSQGTIKLSDGSLRLASPGIELKAMQAELRSNAASDLVELSASATSGDGTIRLQGQTNPQAQQKTLSLSITGDQFLAMDVPQARVWISPNLRFELSRERADLSGEVQVPRAEILPRSLAQGIAPSRDQVILGPQGEAPQAGLLKVYSKVRISLGDNVRFEGFGLKSKLQGSVNASDEPGRPTVARGEIRLIEGRYKAYGQDLTIETGRLLFTGGPITDPAIELRAVRRPTEGVSVGIYARGTLAAPLFTLYSTPEMPQDQQLSWLVLGRGLPENATQGERSAVSDAALSLGVSGGSYLSQKIGAGLKLDEISIAAKPGQTPDQAQFTIGKYLSPKLYISYGIGVFQPGQSFRLLYDLSKHFKLSTESGIESGGDLVYTIEK